MHIPCAADVPSMRARFRKFGFIQTVGGKAIANRGFKAQLVNSRGSTRPRSLPLTFSVEHIVIVRILTSQATGKKHSVTYQICYGWRLTTGWPSLWLCWVSHYYCVPGERRQQHDSHYNSQLLAPKTNGSIMADLSLKEAFERTKAHFRSQLVCDERVDDHDAFPTLRI